LESFSATLTSRLRSSRRTFGMFSGDINYILSSYRR
jgi:hypothetical protein